MLWLTAEINVELYQVIAGVDALGILCATLIFLPRVRRMRFDFLKVIQLLIESVTPKEDRQRVRAGEGVSESQPANIRLNSLIILGAMFISLGFIIAAEKL